MLRQLIKYGVALHVALIVAWSAWARGGSSPVYAWALPWLALGILEIMFLMPPSRSSDSTPRESLRELVRRIALDPITYIGAGLLAFLTTQWLNGPRELEFNVVDNIWEYTDPPVPWLPNCVDRGEALHVLLWFVAAYVVLLAVRHGMKRDDRVKLMKVIVLNGALLSALGIAQAITCPTKLFWYRPMGAQFFATFGYPNHGATFFMMMTALNIGLLIKTLEDRADGATGSGWLSLALFLNAAGMYFTLSRTAIILGTAILVVGALYGLFYLRKAIGKVERFCFISFGVIFLGVIAAMAVLPISPLHKEFENIPKIASMSTEVYGTDRAELADAASRIWADYPWTGVGGWGFRRYVALYMPEEEWGRLLSAGRANVHNDALQFLCEHGIIGFGLMSAIALVLLVQLLARLFTAKRVVDPVTSKQRTWFESVSPVTWACIVAVGVMCVHSTLDLPFRSIANMLVWFIAFASAPYFTKKGAGLGITEKVIALTEEQDRRHHHSESHHEHHHGHDDSHHHGHHEHSSAEHHGEHEHHEHHHDHSHESHEHHEHRHEHHHDEGGHDDHGSHHHVDRQRF